MLDALRSRLRPRRGARPRIACVVSHTDELTLAESVAALEAQTVPVGDVQVVSGLSPCSASYNQALGLARESGADVLFHTAADVLAAPTALEELLAVLHPTRHFVATATGFDVFHGDAAPVGLWVLNLRVITPEHRFLDEYTMDMRFCQRVEAATGTARARVDRRRSMGYHHPIWTAEEIYQKFRYATQKYGPDVKQRYLDFFDRELGYNPDNVVLAIGRDTLVASTRRTHDFGAKDAVLLKEEFAQVADDYGVTGTEFYVLHRRFVPLAQRLLGSRQDCVCLEDRGVASRR